MTRVHMTHLRALAIISAVAALCACTPTESYWTEAQSPKQNRVEAVRLMHDLRLPASGKLSPEDVAGVDAFLARHDVGYGDSVSVLSAPGRNGTALSEYLRKQGLVAQTVAANGQDLPSGSLRLLVERHVVVPPNCPDWSKPARTDYGNTTMSNFGCANASNLGLMLANPRDLIQGQQMGDSDGTASAAAIQRYRAGKVMPLPKASTTE